jgi:ribonucleoside-diphosphate reductase alpha chain
VYLTVGLYEDGSPGELFIQIGKAGSTLNALMDTIGIMASFALQYGVPLEHLCRKLRDMNFSPQGKTSNPDVPECTSIIDYVFRWVQENFAEVHVGAQLEKMAASPMNEGEHYEP